jgi:hypothetical protein
MSRFRNWREAEEYAQEQFREMLPRARQVVEEMAVSPNKRTAAAGRRLLERIEREPLDHPSNPPRAR